MAGGSAVGTSSGFSGAIVVLGCRLHFSDGAQKKGLVGTAARRAAAGAELFALLGGDLPIIVSGGRAWEGVVEADGLRDALVSHGVPQACIVRERCSLSTSDNARFTAMLLRRRGLSRVQIVTCAYHLPRAGALFRAHGLTVTCVPSDDGGASAASRIWRWGRERVCARIDGVTP